MEELGKLILVSLVALLIGYLIKKGKFETEIKELNEEVKTIMDEVRIDLKEARIERDGLIETQQTILKQLDKYERHYSEVMKEEYDKRIKAKKEEKEEKKTSNNTPKKPDFFD
jgi:hypothetical protein